MIDCRFFAGKRRRNGDIEPFTRFDAFELRTNYERCSSYGLRRRCDLFPEECKEMGHLTKLLSWERCLLSLTMCFYSVLFFQDIVAGIFYIYIQHELLLLR